METIDIDTNLLNAKDAFSANMGAIAGMMEIIVVVSAIVGLLMLIELWKIYKKCGKPGWATLIPIYNVWVFLEISGLPGWLCLLPVANAIGLLVAYFKLPKRFGKSAAFGLGILIFPLIFFGILAFSKNAKTDAELGNVEPSGEPTTPVETTPTQPVQEQPQVTPDLMAAEATPLPAVAPAVEEPKPAMEEAPALNLEEPVKEEVVAPVTPEPVSVEVPNEPEVNAFEMPAPAQPTPEVAPEPVQEVVPEPIPVAPTPEVLPQMEVAPAPEVLPQVEPAPIPEPLSNDETVELPKMANEAINNDINATKTCTVCGHVNAYTNKTCEICGATLE